MQAKYRNFVFYKWLFSLKFVSVSLSFELASSSTAIISSHIIAESSIIRAKDFPFSQLHVAGFQT